MRSLPIALLCAAIALVYWRAVGFGYAQFDDLDYVRLTEPVMRGLTPEGVAWAFTTFHMSNWHPLTWLSFMLDVSLFGADPHAQHAVNLVLHGLNSILLYALARALGQGSPVAFLVALFFAVHPLHVESVVWIAERKDLLCALFYIAALRLHLRHVAAPTLRSWWPVFACGVLALLAKPMAVTLPLALLLLDYWPAGRIGPDRAWSSPEVRRALAEKIPLLIVAFLAGLLTMLAQGGAMSAVTDVPLAHRVQNAVVGWATYIRQLLMPTGLAGLYPLRPIDTLREFLPALATVAALSALAILWRRRHPFVSFAWAWFIITLLPVIGLLQVGMQAHADRYMYIPSIGPLLALGAAAQQGMHSWWPRWRLPVCMLALFHGIMAWIQVGYWNGPYMFFERILDVTPATYQAHVGLASSYLVDGDLPRAEHHAAQAQQLAPADPVVIGIVGNVWYARRDYTRAELAFRSVLEIDPASALALYNLGMTLAAQGRSAEAAPYFDQARRLAPSRFGKPQ